MVINQCFIAVRVGGTDWAEFPPGGYFREGQGQGQGQGQIESLTAEEEEPWKSKSEPFPNFY